MIQQKGVREGRRRGEKGGRKGLRNFCRCTGLEQKLE